MIDISRITRAEADVLRAALNVYVGELELAAQFVRTRRDKADTDWRTFTARVLLDGLGPA